MKPELLLQIFGWYGLVAIVAAYTLNSFGIVASTDASYQLLNLTGALGIVAVSWRQRAFQPMWLNVIWSVIAGIALIRLLFA